MLPLSVAIGAAVVEADARRARQGSRAASVACPSTRRGQIGAAMRPRFLVLLTLVRKEEEAHRDEVNRPERTVEAIGAVDRDAAHEVFRAMCALPAVRAGKQRAKVIDLAGRDNWEPGAWIAPLVTAEARRALRRIGMRRRHSWK